MKGHWLDQAGFTIDTPVTVRVMEGCLVLIADNATNLLTTESSTAKKGKAWRKEHDASGL
jgi:hypothetical protein